MPVSRLVTSLLLAALAVPAYAGGGRNRVAGDELPVPVAPGPITVDGDLAEWDEAQAKLLGLDLSGGEDAAAMKPAFADYSARVAMRQDAEALYVAVWWRSPKPLSGAADPAQVPPGDGLVLHLPIKGMQHLALWRQDGTTARALLASGSQPLAAGMALDGVAQAFRVTGATTYAQEVRIPWTALGGRLAAGAAHRIGIDLAFAGLDPAAGYKAALKELDAFGSYLGNRWGGMMCWGFVDGLASLEMINPSMNPEGGAEIRLMPAGSKAPANPAVMYKGLEQTRTTRMIAVPAKGIAVDGAFAAGEWDPATATTIASEPSLLPDRYAVEVHWAYAPAGLYAGLRWRTGGPHLNINDPRRLPHGYDGGDALQIRLLADGRVSHIDAWYHDASRTPAVSLVYGARFNEGKEPAALAKGAQMAIANLPGGGYTQELFLPWALITRKGEALTEGAAMRAILDIFFSGLEGNRIPFIVNARLESDGGLAVPVATVRDGYYSAVIEDPASRRVVRRLWNCVKAGKGQTLPRWDGLTDDGEVAGPGTYQVRGLSHTGVGLEYLTTYNNPGSPSWQTDDGAGDWGGDHGNPNSVAAAPDGVVLAWPAAEDGYGVIGCDLDGRKRWGFFGTPANQGYGDSGTGLVAVDGDLAIVASEVHVSPPKGATYLAGFRTALSCLDRRTGKRTGFSLKEPFTVIRSIESTGTRMGWWWDLWPAREFSLDNRSIAQDYNFNGRVVGGNLCGLAAGKGRIYVAFRTDHCIKVLDAAGLAEVATWKVERPGGLCLAPDGGLYAISGERVLRLDAAGAATPVVTSGLKAPVGIAVAGDGTVYVSEWADVQCVKAFDRDGRLLRSIGRAGGRPWVGAFDPAGMLMPRGIALDPRGRLWVAEDDNHPRRISVWDAASGALVKDFIGGTTYGGVNGGQIAPWDPARAISAGCWFGIDLAKEGYRPLTTLDRRRSMGQVFAYDHAANNAPGRRFLRAGDRRFLTAGEFYGVLGELQADGTWKALCAIGRSNPTPEAKLRWGETPWPAFFAEKHPKDNFIWIDRNRDGECQEEECQWRPIDQELGQWVVYWNTVSFDAGFNAYVGASNHRIVKVPFGGWDDQGLPRYDIAAAALVARMPEGRHEFGAIAVDPDNAQLFTVAEANGWRWGNKKPGLYSFRADGSLAWRIAGNEDLRPMGSINGECVMGPVDAGGELGKVVATTQWHGLSVPLITADGIYVGRVLRDPAEGGEPGPDMFRGECVQNLNRLDDGRIILAHGKNAHHLFRVTGLDTAKRFALELAVTPADAERAAQALREREAGAKQAAAAVIVAGRAPVAVDGRLDDWAGAPAVPIGPADGTPRAQAFLRTGEANLYVAWQVTKAGGYLNKGDDPTRLFLSGDAVDLHLCLDPAPVAGRPEPGAGDLRVVLGRVGGRGVATIYRVKARGPARPQAFSSPNRQVVFEQVVPVAGAKVAVAETGDGYVVEAALPIKELFNDNDAMWVGRRILGDVGVIVADATGRRVVRLYRFNTAAQIVNDVPSESVLMPGQWGTLEVRPEAKR